MANQRKHLLSTINRAILSLLFLGISQQVGGQSIGDDLIQPVYVESKNGVLDTDLSIEFSDQVSAAHLISKTRLLNGTFPGPTIKVRAGDTMKIKFENKLQYAATWTNPTATAATTTQEVDEHLLVRDVSNLHYHGAHVSGELPSDDVTLKVYPGESYQYETHFPESHMPGTHWTIHMFMDHRHYK